MLRVGEKDAAGKVREVLLVITVSNSDEEAHEAMVSIVMPPAFEYLGTDERVCSFFMFIIDVINVRKTWKCMGITQLSERYQEVY